MTEATETEVMLALGDFRFSLATAAYQSQRKTAAWRWPGQERISREPALQFVGPGEQSMELSGVIYPYHAGGLGQMDIMRAEAEKGEPLFLTDGLGNYWGKWVLTRVEETQKLFFADDTPRKIEFKLSLKKYGE